MIKVIPTFLNSENISINEIKNTSFTILGVPYEKGCAGRLGTAHGPEAIRQASLQYSWPKWNGFYDPRLDKRVLVNAKIIDIGNLDNQKSDSDFRQLITTSISKIINSNSFPIILGGDHSITFDILKAFKEEIQIIHLDAHGDYQRLDETDAFPSGVVMRKVSELSSVTKIIQIGMRGYLNSSKGFNDSRDDGNVVIPWNQYQNDGIKKLLANIDKEIPVYISLDTDFLDPTICPGTTVPEPSGPNFCEAQELICKIAESFNIKGLDVVELNPNFDPAGISSLHVAKLILDFMAVVYEKK